MLRKFTGFGDKKKHRPEDPDAAAGAARRGRAHFPRIIVASGAEWQRIACRTSSSLCDVPLTPQLPPSFTFQISTTPWWIPRTRRARR